jgi:hypothetical protein
MILFCFILPLIVLPDDITSSIILNTTMIFLSTSVIEDDKSELEKF